MPAHTRGDTKLDAWFARILYALCLRTGGEIRIKGAEIDSIDKKVVLMSDWDSETQELVIRVGSSFNEVYRVLPESPARWVPTQTVQPTDQPPSSPEKTLQAPRSTLDENDRLRDLERKLLRNRILVLLKRERMSRAAEESHLPPLNSNTSE